MGEGSTIRPCERAAWRLTRTMPQEEAAARMGVNRETIECHLSHVYETRRKTQTMTDRLRDDGHDLAQIVAGTPLGREFTYRNFRLIRTKPRDLTSEYAVVDRYTGEVVDLFDPGEYDDAAALRTRLDEIHDLYWGE